MVRARRSWRARPRTSTCTAGPNQTVNEGDTVSLTGSFIDPFDADTHTYDWHVVAPNGQTIADGTGPALHVQPGQRRHLHGHVHRLGPERRLCFGRGPGHRERRHAGPDGPYRRPERERRANRDFRSGHARRQRHRALDRRPSSGATASRRPSRRPVPDRSHPHISMPREGRTRFPRRSRNSTATRRASHSRPPSSSTQLPLVVAGTPIAATVGAPTGNIRRRHLHRSGRCRRFRELRRIDRLGRRPDAPPGRSPTTVRPAFSRSTAATPILRLATTRSASRSSRNRCAGHGDKHRNHQQGRDHDQSHCLGADRGLRPDDHDHGDRRRQCTGLRHTDRQGRFLRHDHRHRPRHGDAFRRQRIAWNHQPDAGLALDQGILFGRHQLPRKQRDYQHDRGQSVDHRARPDRRQALGLSGNASINVSGGVYVDSSSSSALSASGNAQIKASVIDVHGGVQKSGNATFSPSPITNAASLPDPLAGLAGPGTSGLTELRFVLALREFQSDDQARHLQPDRCLGQRRPHPELRHVHHPGGWLHHVWQRQCHRLGRLYLQRRKQLSNPSSKFGAISLDRQRHDHLEPGDHRAVRRHLD